MTAADTAAVPVQPLAGLRVLELGGGVAGAYATKLFADFGADVVKVEPPGGDPLRQAVVVPGDPDPGAAGPLHLHLDTNKRSAVLDLDLAADRAIVAGLVARADLVVESFPPGTMSAWGLGYDELRALRPGLVVTSITPFGQDGPYRDLPGEDIVTYAMGGPMASTGVVDREPVKLAGLLTSYQVGNVAATASMGALTLARCDGESVHVDLAALEAQVASIDRRVTYLLYFAYTGTTGARLSPEAMGVVPRGVFPCADGYVLVSGNPMWRGRMAATLGDPELGDRLRSPNWLDDPSLAEDVNAALYGWLADRTRAEATTEAQANRWPITPLNLPVELLSDPHFAARRFFVDVEDPHVGHYRLPGAPFRMANGWQLHRTAPRLDEHGAEIRAEAATAPPTTATATATATATRRLPLEGIRVLDLTVVWAGPYTTMLLGDLGAEIIRFDNPWIFPASSKGQLPRPSTALAMQLGPIGGCYPNFAPGRRPWNQHGIYAAHARNKLGATLDLRRPSGREAFLRLVDGADVVVENNSVDLLDRLGLDVDTLRARNPRLVVVRLPSVGLDGPYRDYTGFGVNFEALCALSPLRGYRDLDPTSLSLTYHMDAASGAAGAFATMCALRRRDRTGVGELVEVPQSENMLSHIGEYIVDASRTGRRHEPLGNRNANRAPQGCYPCVGHDAWVVLSVGSDEQWAALRRAMGDPDWAADARFDTATGRHTHHDELDEGLGAWTASLTAREVSRRCLLEGVPAAPVADEAGCFANPHLLARSFFRPQGSADIGTYPFPSHQWRWDGPPLRFGPISRMGADNAHVFRTIAGLDDEEYAALEAEGHFSEDYLTPDGQPY